MSDSKLTPEPLLKIGTGFWLSKVVSVATQIGIFTSIHNGHAKRHDLSSELDIDERSLRAILNACVALGLLKKDGDSYLNTELSDTFLVKGKPSYFGDLIIMQGTRLYDAWSHLEDTVKNGRPSTELFSAMEKDNKTAKQFTDAMHNNAIGTAKQVATKIDCSSFSSLMDIGGGSGAYAIELAQKYPHLEAHVVELPSVCSVADEYIAKAGVDDRVKTFPADVFNDPLPATCDLAFVSQVLHSYSPDECSVLLSRIYDSLKSNGTLIVHEFFMDDDENGPLFPALFAVNMLLESKHGTSYTRSEVGSWLTKVGFRDVRSDDLMGPSGMLIAVKS